MKNNGRRQYQKIYDRLSKKEKEKIRNTARMVCGEHFEAVIDYISTDMSVTAIAQRRYISEATLYRAINNFFESI